MVTIFVDAKSTLLAPKNRTNNRLKDSIYFFINYTVFITHFTFYCPTFLNYTIFALIYILYFIYMNRFFKRTKKNKKSKIKTSYSNSLAEQIHTSPFTIVLVRHCQSCANVANPIGPFGGHINKFWRQPLCTNKGVQQAIAAGIILPKILKELGLSINPPFGSSILPRAFATAKITSIPFDNPITLPTQPPIDLYKHQELSSTDTEEYDKIQTEYLGGYKIQRTHSRKTYNINSTPPNPKSIFRIAYIKEKMNAIDPYKKFAKNTGTKQSQNLTSVEHSDSYLLAINNIFSTHDEHPIGRHISMNPTFLENIVGGNEHTSEKVRKKLVESSWDSFELEVLPKLRKFCQANGSNCIVLFVHGHLLEDALNRTSNNSRTTGKDRNVWKNANNESKKRRNLSIHTIGYNDDGTKTIRTNHQLRHLPSIDQKLINTYIRKIDIADPMFKCKYKYHRGKAHIVSRANQESRKKGYNLSSQQSRKKNKTRRIKKNRS